MVCGTVRNCAVLVCVLALGSCVALPAADDFEPLVFKDAQGKSLPYRLLKPKDYDAKQKYPLLVFFHGAGERGTDNQNQLKHVVRTFAKDENRTKYPCFVVAPQCPNGMQWVDTPWGNDSHIQPEKPTEAMRLAVELLGALQKEFSIDPQRFYAMGLSMGGFAVWDAITRYPAMFAAGVPMCGGADENKAPQIAQLPVWAFHGGQDNVVKTKRSQNMIAALKKAGGDPKYTEYPGVGHDCWAKAAGEPALLDWLFAQKRK